ncbi:hypothetical protein RF397_01395, partial [Acinetobacter baumannii]|nr:hypothetical protein [Acinetobacter baumannii]
KKAAGQGQEQGKAPRPQRAPRSGKGEGQRRAPRQNNNQPRLNAPAQAPRLPRRRQNAPIYDEPAIPMHICPLGGLG